MKKVFITVDVEHDCPPILTTTCGMQQGMPKLLDLLSDEKIPATFFTTGKMAEEFPKIIARIVEDKHELGCHGHTHRRFDQMTYQEAEREIEAATKILRQYTKVVSFRAPNLSFPDEYLPILVKNRFQIDSSLARYKKSHAKKIDTFPGIQRVKTSMPGYCFRLPLFLSKPWIKHLDAIVLLMHPWECIDMSKTGVRFDSFFNTGEPALKGLKKWIEYLKKKNYQFLMIRDYVT